MLEQNKLERVIDGLSKIEQDEKANINSTRAKFCKEFIETVFTKNISLNKVCPFNYYHINQNFEDLFDNNGYKEHFGLFYICCVRFLKEYIFYLSRQKSSDVFIRALWDSFEEDDLSLLDEICQKQVLYIKNEMGVDILNFYFGDEGFQSFLNFSNNIKQANIKSEEIKQRISDGEANLRKLLDEKQAEAKVLSDKLEKQKTAFNFVGLSQGFENLLKTKKSARSYTFFFLLCVSAFLFVVPAAYIKTIMNFSVDTINDPYIWKLAIPFTGGEIILLYFFRVILNHYNSLQTQIMQLELRQSLCQFIQNYADYAKEMKEKDGASLEKFENLIFSSILSNSDKVPSTFDGLEQLSNLIKNIKSGS
ncbi:hypothetical protein ACTUM7_06850 [Basfia succiniciproducens]|uniref:hypothetical protein n=1 Tax=Basfia succiniciproducens TaxID=653940 RepID=UPI003FCDFF1A